jgi:pyruvate dehydrogenase E1 component alpha subunit
MADPDLYRTKDEIEHWKERDPIALHEARLRAAGLLADADVQALEEAVTAELDAAVAAAESGEPEPVESLTTDVYTPVTP